MSTAFTDTEPAFCSEEGLTDVSVNRRASFEATDLTSTRKNTARHYPTPGLKKDSVVVKGLWTSIAT